jgi:hypothetical protein
LEEKVISTAVVFDCEFLTNETSPRRFWCGPMDPDPVVAQIGAVRLSLVDTFEILETLSIHVVPVDRHGARYALDPFFTKLTGITEDEITQKGVSLDVALRSVDAFSNGARLWSWGKDEFNMVAISCYVAGIPAVIPAARFENACKLVRRAGMPQEDMNTVRSNTLADYYKIEHPPLQGHDALGDALSVAYALQHLLQKGSLAANDFAEMR